MWCGVVQHTISIMNIHGTRDTEIPALGAISVSGWLYSPVDEIMKVWASYNECTGELCAFRLFFSRQTTTRARF